MELKDKVAVVTGVSKGIGKHVVQQLLEKGCKVAGWGRHTPEIEDNNFRFFETDVSSYGQVKQALMQTRNAFGKNVHILINNAGLGYFGYLDEMEVEKFDEMMQVNVYGTYYCCKEVIPVMKESNGGHIINISSIAGLDGVTQGAGYSAAKFAITGFSNALFKELRNDNIKVSSVHPGSTKTNFFDSVGSIEAHDNMMMPEDVATQIIRLLETPDNFLINQIVFRPLQPKPPKS